MLCTATQSRERPGRMGVERHRRELSDEERGAMLLRLGTSRRKGEACSPVSRGPPFIDRLGIIRLGMIRRHLRPAPSNTPGSAGTARFIDGIDEGSTFFRVGCRGPISLQSAHSTTTRWTVLEEAPGPRALSGRSGVNPSSAMRPAHHAHRRIESSRSLACTCTAWSERTFPLRRQVPPFAGPPSCRRASRQAGRATAADRQP